MLNHKQVYRDLKYQVSEDFSDIRDMEKRRGSKFTSHESIRKEPIGDPDKGSDDGGGGKSFLFVFCLFVLFHSLYD